MDQNVGDLSNLYSNPTANYTGSLTALLPPPSHMFQYNNSPEMENYLISIDQYSMQQETKRMDINHLLQKVMSITDQSLKEAEKRYLVN